MPKWSIDQLRPIVTQEIAAENTVGLCLEAAEIEVALSEKKSADRDLLSGAPLGPPMCHCRHSYDITSLFELAGALSVMLVLE